MPNTAYRTSLRIVDDNGNLIGILPETISSQILDFATAVRSQIAPARNTSTNFTSNNPVLEDGRLGIETNTGRLKIGDGVTAWNSLGYFAPPAAVPVRYTAAVFTSTNPVLGDGILGIETDTGNLKIGDGSTAWNSLAYTVNNNTSVVFELST
jgi:hypothetical protein